jgi:hypothetical protein
MNEEHLVVVSVGVFLDAFVNTGHDVVIQNVVKYVLHLRGGAGSASVTDEKR